MLKSVVIRVGRSIGSAAGFVALVLLAASGDAAPAALAQAEAAPPKKILFLAGPRDHGMPGRHEYERDLKTLAQSLEQSTNLKGVTTQLIVGSLPRDLAAVNDAAAIVIESSSDRAADETHPLFPPNPGFQFNIFYKRRS